MNALQIIEAETPKKALRASRGRIKPGRGYWLNIARADEAFEDGEFCPAQISPVNVLSTLDGLYGLSADVAKAMERLDPTFTWDSPEGENLFSEEMLKYETPIWDSVRRGVTSGTVNGVDGQKKWQIVFQRDNDEVYNERFYDPRPVEPGVDYPTEPLGEAENPKKAMRHMRPNTQISGPHTDVGQVGIGVEFSDGSLFTVEMPIKWAKWQDNVMVDLPLKPQNGISEEQWRDVIGVVEYGLNEGYNSADHHDFRDEDVDAPGQPYMARMYWKILAGYTIEQLQRRAYEKLFPMPNY